MDSDPRVPEYPGCKALPGGAGRARLTIVSDFDGVLTDPVGEAARTRELFMLRLMGPLGDAAEELLVEAEAAVMARPHQHGWEIAGRLTAYADEDPFIRLIAASTWLDHRASDGHEALLAARRQFDGSIRGQAHVAFIDMCNETRRGDHAPLDPAMPAAFRALLDAGHDVVIVSNSATDRIDLLLAGAGLTPDDRLRVRGNARKFDLAGDSQLLELDGRRFDTARPAYAAILQDERPDVVIGDVFSLDLALPYAMLPGCRLLLQRRRYTPARSAALVDSLGGGVLDRLDELPERPVDSRLWQPVGRRRRPETPVVTANRADT